MANASKDDSGLTLIELLVYVVVSSIVLLVVSTIIISAVSGQSVVVANSSTSGNSRAIARSMEVGVGNASDISIEAASAYGQMVRVRTAVVTSSSTTWRCQAWFYSSTMNAFYVKSSTSTISNFTATPNLTTWTLVAGGTGDNKVVQQTSTPTPAGSPTILPVFSPVGRGGQTVSVDLSLTSGADAKLSFSTGFGSQALPSPHPVPTEVPSTCF